MTLTTEDPAVTDRYPTRRAGAQKLLPREEPTVWGSAADGPLDQATLDGFDADGFLAVEQILDEAEIAAYTAEMRRLATDLRFMADSRTVVDRDTQEVRAIFEVHRISELFRDLANDPRLVDKARQILGSDVYVHQSRVNYKRGLTGNDFYWHSDFETWHAEDGMPGMRAVGISIALHQIHVCNGGLMIMPGSHKTFVPCEGEPSGDYQWSLAGQEIAVPDPESLALLADRHGIHLFTGAAGHAVIFDPNCMHGSNGNITPYPRSTIFVVYNSVENTLVEPYAAVRPRPDYIAARDFAPVAG
ncbi:MAG: ectoine hydroxylase [Micromonosporaceae bacterium]|nr:ectoine hydroxylase [Micromonosporaceae bacterium]